MQIEVDLSDVHAKIAQLDRDLDTGLSAVTQDAIDSGVKTAKQEAPSKTGQLRSKIEGHITQASALRVAGEVVANAKHASFVNDGTKPHAITGNPLRFEAGGDVVFTKRVSHPGTKPQPFMDAAERAAQSTLTSKTVAMLNTAAAKFSA